ncbi:histidine phosphatase family protein [Cellulomonas wangsupingiae]|uniref:Histidine phosphatase family protein n=1 Tax=Cellulomonas wangsupingiae TaxID=2968085 RepID=A0ABY5K641_9CELL|nr:histidine phosphatase family protein [Cellulomonas wangsupingiae]MCC2334946.1 histidine phosphatase family protein [Cellulomonas wangsupingiae]MCM0638819.1 histidine phosphatase family protein [Cellulomonas wangsupingiae]UUI65445.1 histidine phosphatase family protein [Cellulomonas wangsupingiae]
MATRHLYLARHGAADAFGELTATGRRQAGLLGERLAHVPADAVWHSPLPRAAASAHELARHLPGVPVAAADELVDHVPHVPAPAQTPPPWRGFFDGYDEAEARAGRALADALTARFGSGPGPGGPDTHEVLVTHAYQIAWLVRHALDAPEARWLGLDSANAALTVLELRPGLPPTLVMFNDMSHLPADLRWTGFPATSRP